MKFNSKIKFLSFSMLALMLLNIIGLPIFSHHHTFNGCHTEDELCCTPDLAVDEYICCTSDFKSDLSSHQEDEPCCWEELTFLRFCFDTSFEVKVKAPHFITAFIQESSIIAIENSFRSQAVSIPTLPIPNISKKLSLFQVYRI